MLSQVLTPVIPYLTCCFLQVLRVSYDKQQRRAQRSYSTSKSEDQPFVKKTRTSKDRFNEHVPDAENRETSCTPTTHITGSAVRNSTNRDSLVLADNKVHDSATEACKDGRHDDSVVESEPHGDDHHSPSFIKRMPNPIRSRIRWTDESDRSYHKTTLS